MFLLEWIDWIRNRLAFCMAMRKIRKNLEGVDLVPTEIFVILFNNSIEISLGWNVKVKYVDRGDYCKVEWNTYTKNSEERTKKIKYHQNFLDVFFNDFAAILQISKPHLRDLVILMDGCHFVRYTKEHRSKQYRQSGVPDTTMLKLFENYQKIMDFFKDHPMRIKKLKITVFENSQISQMLTKIKTEELSIMTTFGGVGSLDFEEIVKLKNWKSIKYLSLLDFSVVHPVNLFIDKPTLFLTIDDISSEEIRLIAETFRNNPNMEEWHLNFDDHLDVMDLLVSELGQPSQEDDWYFNVPGSEKVFHVSIWSEIGKLSFYNLDRDEVSEGIEIY